VEAQAAHRRVPGVQAAIRSGDELVLSAAVGVADALAGTPLTTEHLFPIASHSKTFTATAVLQLVEAGRMRLDDPIGDWVPELRAGGSPLAAVTVRELLGHQAGVVRDGGDADFWQLVQPFPGIEELEVVDAGTLRVAAQPGFGPAGEPIRFERDTSGRIESLRFGGVTKRPVEDVVPGRS
jgi:D-alanyl-D-alanine carboxypeptidase